MTVAAPHDAPAATQPIGVLLASADAAAGEASAKKCVACHSFAQGEANKVGPNLWGIVGRPVASIPEYKYSEAMVAFSEGGAKHWTIDELDRYLLDPRKHVPGTKMAFPGLKKDDERANVVAYLNTLGAAPTQ